MKKRWLYVLWGGMFSVCAGLGFIPEPQGAVRGLLTGLSVLCFAPPALLLIQAGRNGDRDTVKLVGSLAGLSLLATLVCLILNFLSAMGSEILGSILYVLLVIVSSPMVCSGCWVLSLFMWACLMIVSRNLLKKKKGTVAK